MDHFLWGLPPEEAWAVGMSALISPDKMMEALECAHAMLGEQTSSHEERWPRDQTMLSTANLVQ